MRGRTVTEGAFSSPALAATVSEWARLTRFHAALASASSMVPYLRLSSLRGVPAVVDLVDVDSQKWLDYAAASRGPAAWLYRTEARRLRQLEQSLPDWTRAVTLVSTKEADVYRQFRSTGVAHAVPNGVDLDYFQPSAMRAPDDSTGPPLEQACVFVGALDYRPNVDAIRWFCREVWPELLRHCPVAKLYLVGRKPALAVRACATVPGVELVGPVPDVRPYLSRVPVAIAPLQIARGIQNKVLEAMAMGRAVITSPQALTGLDATPGLHLLTASTRQQWVDTILWLWSDSSLWRALGSAARRYVEQHHCWERCLTPFAELLGLGRNGRPAPAECRIASA
jgi:sugar transferase (PEP-CTERM/EpsH1 system associated)